MPEDVCDVCGSTNVKEIKCKVICQNCGTILRSCADLGEGLRN
jgi:rubredoxin